MNGPQNEDNAMDAMVPVSKENNTRCITVNCLNAKGPGNVIRLTARVSLIIPLLNIAFMILCSY